MACCRSMDSGYCRPGYGTAFLEEVTINPTIEVPELTQDWRNRLLEGTNRNLCTRTQEKGAVTPQETDPDLAMSVRESPTQAYVCRGLQQGWGH